MPTWSTLLMYYSKLRDLCIFPTLRASLPLSLLPLMLLGVYLSQVQTFLAEMPWAIPRHQGAHIQHTVTNYISVKEERVRVPGGLLIKNPI